MPGANTGNTLSYPKRATLDVELLLHDTAAAITSSAAGAVGGSAKVIDFGAETPAADVPEVIGLFIVDISSIDVSDGDESYSIVLEFSDTADFSSGSPVIEEVCRISAGAAAVTRDSAASGAGRLAIPFTNNKKGQPLRYGRVFAVLAGTTPSIAYNAWLAVNNTM